MIKEHAQVFLDLLGAATGSPALVVHDGAVPQGSLPPYVLAYIAVEVPGVEIEPDKSDLTYASKAVRARAILHSVGIEASAAREVADRARGALLDVRPSLAGRTSSPIRWTDGQDTRRDEQIGSDIFDQIDVYQFGSYPA